MVYNGRQARSWRLHFASGGLALSTFLAVNAVAQGSGAGQQVQISINPRATTIDPLSTAVRTYQPTCNDLQNVADADYCDQRKGTKAARAQASIALVQAFIGVAGIVALVQTLRYTAKATKAAQSAADAAISSVAAAQMSAKAAEASIKQAAEVARKQLRAYVTFSHIKTNEETDSKGTFLWASYSAVIINSGATPARKVRSYIAFSSYESLKEDGWNFPVQFGNKTSVSTIGPNGATLEIAPIGQLTKVEFNSRISFLVYGAVDYIDIFGVARRTEFCETANLFVNEAGKPTSGLTKEDQHNGTDEDCMRSPYAEPNDPIRLRET